MNARSQHSMSPQSASRCRTGTAELPALDRLRQHLHRDPVFPRPPDVVLQDRMTACSRMYMPLAVFFIWMIAMTATTLQAIKREEAAEAGPRPAAVDPELAMPGLGAAAPSLSDR